MTSLIPFPTKVPGLIAAWATPVTIYGASGAGAKTLASQTIPGNSFLPNSVIEINADFDFPTPPHGGRTLFITLGGNTLAQAFPGAAVGSISIKWLGYVAPDLKSITVISQNANTVLSPVAGNGAPFSALSNNHTSITIDLTQAQIFTVTGQPVNDDIMTLNGFSVTQMAMPNVNMAPALATAFWGDSLTSGTGSLGAFILHATGNTSSGTNTILSASSISGILPGMVVTGTGIPANTMVLSASGTTITMSTNASATGTAVAVTIMAGPPAQQIMYNSAGRPTANLGVGGQTSTQIAARAVADVIRGKYWNCVFDMGENDIGGSNPAATVSASLVACIANLASGTKFVVNTLTPNNSWTIGGTNWNQMVAINAAIRSAYPAKYADISYALTANETTHIALQYRNCTVTTGSITGGSPTLTVASATGLSTGMYCISPGSTAINNGSTATAPTISAIAGTTITLSANASATLSGAMVSFVSTSEAHLNDLGYAIKAATILSALTAQGI